MLPGAQVCIYMYIRYIIYVMYYIPYILYSLYRSMRCMSRCARWYKTVSGSRGRETNLPGFIIVDRCRYTFHLLAFIGLGKNCTWKIYYCRQYESYVLYESFYVQVCIGSSRNAVNFWLFAFGKFSEFRFLMDFGDLLNQTGYPMLTSEDKVAIP